MNNSGLKKASDILILIGYIISIIAAVAFLAFGIICVLIAAPNNKEIIINGLKDGSIHTSFVGTVEEQAAQIQSMFVYASIICFISAIIFILASIFSYFSTHRDEKHFQITSLIFAALTGNVVLIVGEAFRISLKE